MHLDHQYLFDRPMRISYFTHVYLRELIEAACGRRAKHMVTTVPRPFRGKTSGPPFIYVWWYHDEGQYFYDADIEKLRVAYLRRLRHAECL